jgi:DNA-binding MarR family transcriptional regulator
MHPITESIFALYDQFIKQLYDSQKELSINLVGVNVVDEACLDTIYHAGALTPSEIAHKLGVTTSAVTQMLKKYEKLHLIQKKPSPKDKRSIVVSLNPHVVKRFEDTYNEFDKQMSERLKNLTSHELAELNRVLIKLMNEGKR